MDVYVVKASGITIKSWRNASFRFLCNSEALVSWVDKTHICKVINDWAYINIKFMQTQLK